MPTAQLKRYYSVKEASKLLGVSTNTIYTYLDTGKIKARRIGRGRFKIPFKELAPFVDFDSLIEKQTAVNESLKVEEPSVGKFEIIKTPHVILNSSHNVEEKTEESVPQVVPEANVLVKPEAEKIVEETNILLSPGKNDQRIVSGANDKVLWRIFKSLALAGLGIIYIFSGDKTYNFSGHLLQESGEVLGLIMPYALLVGGLITLVDSFFEKRFRHYDVLVHILNGLVLSYFSFMALASGEYGRFVFAGSMAVLIISHLVQGVKHMGSFFDSFTKYTVLVSIVGGVVILINPDFFPLPYLNSIVTTHKGIFAVTWFSLLTVPALFMLSEGGRNSKSFISLFYFLAGLMTIIYATQLSIEEKWDIAYVSYLMAVFGLFLSWWNQNHSSISQKRLSSLSVSFVWVSAAILVGLFVVSGVSSNLKKEKEALTLSNLQDSKENFESVLDKARSLLVGYAGNADVVSLMENGDEESSVQKAKEIFEKSEFGKRTILINKDGYAIGVYPREPVVQGTRLSARQYFVETIENYKGTTSNIFVNLKGDNSMVVTEPVFKDNQIFGVLVLGLDLEKLSLKVQSDFPSNYKIHVLDPKGTYALGSSIKDIGEKKDDLSYLNEESNKSTSKDTLVYQSSLNSPPFKFYLITPPPVLGSDSSYINILLSVFIVVNAAFSVFAGVVSASQKELETGSSDGPPLSALAAQQVQARIR